MKTLEESVTESMDGSDTRISVKIARAFECTVTGIDAIPEFILEARKLAHKYKVMDRCKFVIGAIWLVIKDPAGFADIIIPGAIGPVLGDNKLKN